MSNRRFKILGIAGSLRRASYNRGLLRAAQEVAPSGIDIDTIDLTPIPLYNADVEAQGDPTPVRELKSGLVRPMPCRLPPPSTTTTFPASSRIQSTGPRARPGLPSSGRSRSR